MTRLISTRSLVASAIALGAVLAVSGAQARTDVQYQHAPVHTIERQPVSAPFGHDRDRFEQSNRGGPFGDADHDGVPNRFDRDSRYYDARATYNHPRWGDYDRDGVVNQFDRFPRNPRRH